MAVRREMRIVRHGRHASGRRTCWTAMASTRPRIIGAYVFSSGRSGHSLRAAHHPPSTAAYVPMTTAMGMMSRRKPGRGAPLASPSEGSVAGPDA